MFKLPPSLIESLKNINGFDEDAFIEVHQSGAQVTSIRVNTAKITSETSEVILQQPASINDQLSTTPVPWCSTGRYLSERPSFTFDPSFHAGAYYVQEASSMFLDHILKELFTKVQPARVLDLCAAPGGKSTLLAAQLKDSFIVSNEVIKSRVTILAENISKWGSSNVVVTHNDPRDFKKLAGYFDLIIADAPCSGSGLFRKDVTAIEEWSEANVQMCSQRQQRILADAIPSLTNNGYLIYSTCSYSKDEDEDICDWIIDHLQLESVPVSIKPGWGIVETFSDKHHAAGYRFYPDKLKGEGFFAACFKQVNEVDEYYNSHSQLPPISKTEMEIVAPFIHEINNYNFFRQKETIIAYPKKYKDEIATIQKTLNVRKSGVGVGVIKGKDLIPHHELALSHLLHSHVPAIELDYNNAIRYLQRQDLTIDIPGKGWALARYKNLNLGWMKVLPNRINNYYPTEWRILKH